ncbi:LuxR C-terminal-related transcriptional regulator [Chitinophaga rhizophila]|uniref:Response regulator transcription factor n=1 Tax=Chitinophaga rhizophila TaxID=2866212 RepID=A0ABS7G9X2_9BACT|nr:response regulator transcription factor [Chitinophaga rhizophila]MBW8684457.1 response regulator transcription factor [Chitinophaga rhizophila]
MIRLFLVNNHPLILEGLHSFCDDENDIIIAGHARSGYDCLEFLLHNSVDMIVIDTCLPDIDSAELCASIKVEYPTVNIVVLSFLKEERYIARLLQSGAGGYVLNTAEKEELLFAIRSIQDGELYLSPAIKQAMSSERGGLQKNFPPLTRREKEVLSLISEGNTNAEIAEKLFISADTVNSHRKKLLAKLEVKNTAMLIKYAVDNKLLV